jgi:hypothetical protein
MKRSTTVLAVLLIVAGAALWADRSCRGTDDVLRARTRLYPDFDRRRVAEITLDGKRLDGDRLEAVIAELDYGRLERRLPKNATLGLDPPRATLSVREISGAVRTFTVGADAPGGVYVARSGEEEAYVVQRRFYEVLTSFHRLR